MPQYMKIEGIKGNVTTKDFQGAIQVNGLQQLSERAVIHKVGSGNREIGLPHLDHLQLTKEADDASTALWQHFYQGKSIPKVEITRCTLNDGKAEWLSKITLNNVMVSNMQDQAHSGGNREVLQLSFSKIERSYRSQSSSGQWQTPKHTSFDIETAEVG